MMRGLETDQIIDKLYLGSMGDASYIPFREKHGITALCNLAIEAQPPPNPENMEIKTIAWKDSEKQA